MPRTFDRITGIAVLSWVAAIALGTGVLMRYATTPGKDGDPPARWPQSTSISRVPGGFTLVLAAHPRCFCTRATLSELAKLMARGQGRLATRVLFVQPPGVSEDWTRTDLWRQAEQIPGVVPILDRNGVEATRFGAHTSGSGAVYDAAGRLVFRGGITGSRGMAGDNRGRQSIEDLLGAGSPPPSPRNTGSSRTPVFGCPLSESDSTPPHGVARKGSRV